MSADIKLTAWHKYRLAGVCAAFGAALATFVSTPAAHADTTFPYAYHEANGSTVIIPSEPKRIVDLANMASVSGLGADVVGSVAATPGSVGYSSSGWPAWLNGGETASTEDVGPYQPPNYEQITALKPDLIIGGDTPAIQANLAQIAPDISPCCVTVPIPNFGFEATLLDLAPLFNATAHVNAIIARLHQRARAAQPFVQGTSVAVIYPVNGSANFYMYGSGMPVGGPLAVLGATDEDTVPGGPPAGTSTLGSASVEDLPEITAQKVLVLEASIPKATFQTNPLYSQIPAVRTGQVYFTHWQTPGSVGTADFLTQMSKEMFGVTPLEATLAGVGAHAKGRSGIADVDVGPTDKRVCWAITSTGVRHPGAVRVLGKRGAVVSTLSRRYVANGCAAVSATVGRALAAKPKSYRVSIGASGTTSALAGPLAADSPAFAGNGKDTQYNQ